MAAASSLLLHAAVVLYVSRSMHSLQSCVARVYLIAWYWCGWAGVRVGNLCCRCDPLLPQPSLVMPLDKHTKVLEPGQGNGMFQYYVKVT